MPKPMRPLDLKLRELTDVRGEDDCWMIRNANGGYGYVHHNGKQMIASRAAYTVYVGPIPPGMNVLHRCDTPGCVNPRHLFIGTQSDNVADMVSKHRQAVGDKVRKAGEKNGRSKLTDTQRQEIITRRSNGELISSIANHYGVNVSQVIRLCAGVGLKIGMPKKWTNLQRSSQENARRRSPASYARDVKGSKHPQVKLTEENVIEVLSWDGSTSTTSAKGLAGKFGVSISLIQAIRAGRCWAHLFHHHHKFKSC